MLFQDDRSVSLGDGGMGLTTLPPPVDKGPAHGARMSPNVEVGAARARVYMRDVDVKVFSASGDPVAFTLAGLVDEHRLAEEAARIPAGTFYWEVLVVAMGALSLPLAKLWFLGRRSRLRRIDVAFLATAALVAVLLSSILFLTAFVNNRWGARLDQRLAQVAHSARERIASRLDASARTLNGIVQRRAPPAPACTPVIEETRVDSARWEPARLGEPGIGIARANLSWIIAFLASDEGDPLAWFAPGDHALSVINLRDRPYFRRVLSGDVRCLAEDAVSDDASKCSVPPAAADVLRSIASGNIALYLARLAPTVDDEDPTRREVAGLLVDVDDLIHPQLPLGFALAVLDESGTVLLHSGHDAHHGEKFFEDIDDPRDLQATIAARSQHPLDIRYAGVPSRAYVEHLPSVRWDVVVWANKDVVDVPTTDLVVVTAIELALVAAGFVFLCAAGAAIWVVAVGGRATLPRFHVRPSGATPLAYARLGWQALAVTVILCAATVAAPPWVPRLLILAFEALAIYWCGRRVWQLQSPPGQCPLGLGQGRAWDRTPLAYAGALFAVSGILFVAPTFTLFRIAYDHVSASILVAERSHIVEARQTAAFADARQTARRQGDIDCHTVDDSQSVDAACHEPARPENACPFVFDAASSDRVDADSRSTWVEQPYVTPLLDEFPPLPAIPGDRSSRWYRSAVGAGETLDLLAGACDPWRVAVLLATFIVGGVLLHWIAYRSLRRLFFIDVSISLRSAEPVPDAMTLVERAAAPPQRDKAASILVIHPTARLASQLAERCAVFPASVGGRGAATQGTEAEAPLPVALVPDLIDCLRLPEKRQKEIQRAVANGSVIVLSRADPWRRLAGAARGEWAAALAACKVFVDGPDLQAQLPPTAPLGAAATGQECPREALYITQWNDSDAEEQRVLAQLAIDRHPSPHRENCGTMGHLARRGLLDVCTLTIRDPDFRAFVASQVTSADLDRHESDEGPNAWKTLRVPLATAASAAVVMLAQGSPELQATGIIFPAVFAAVQVILRTLGAPEPPARA